MTLNWDKEHQPVVSVPIVLLKPADSARSEGLSENHIQMIAGTTAPIPPITVHRSTMKVIDGMHRLRAAQVRKLHAIDVQFFDGTDDQAFVLGVVANVYHGKPLTLSERKRAARRILSIYPTWSDRRIAESAGLSHRTVATLRPCPTGQNDQPNARVGKDGRVHPLTNSQGRLAAAEFIEANPTASLRDVAREVGVSPGTVRDVRARLARGQSPVPIKHDGRESPIEPNDVRDNDVRAPGPYARRQNADSEQRHVSPADALQRLSLDPAMRFNNNGRAVIRSLAASIAGLESCEELASGTPDYCAESIAKVASATGNGWLALAAALRNRMAIDADVG